MMRWGNISEREMWWIGTAGSEISCSGWIIYAVLFSPPCKCGPTISPRGGARRACVQSLGAPIFQLINFIFTHLFLNVLSDGNAAGRGSEVLTWQMGLKGEVSQCQRQDFNSKLRELFFFLLLFMESENHLWKVYPAHSTWHLTVPLLQYESCTWSVWASNALL